MSIINFNLAFDFLTEQGNGQGAIPKQLEESGILRESLRRQKPILQVVSV
jgi:hypothetical protein